MRERAGREAADMLHPSTELTAESGLSANKAVLRFVCTGSGDTPLESMPDSED